MGNRTGAALRARREQQQQITAQIHEQREAETRAALEANRLDRRRSPRPSIASTVGAATGTGIARGVGEAVVAPTAGTAIGTSTATGLGEAMPPGSQSFVVNVPTGQLSAAGRVAQISAAEQRGMPLTLRTAASAEPENTGDLLTDGDGNVIEDGEGHPISTGPEPKMATISSDFSSPVETLAQVGQDVTVQLTGIEVKGEVGSLAPSASVGRRGSGRNWRDRGPGRFGGSPPGWHRRQCEYHARPAIPYAI